MYFKLAIKNVKRSIKDYLIYVMTLTACISLFYAFLSITSRYYKPDIGAEFNLEVLGDGMLLVILLITTIICGFQAINSIIDPGIVEVLAEIFVEGIGK